MHVPKTAEITHGHFVVRQMVLDVFRRASACGCLHQSCESICKSNHCHRIQVKKTKFTLALAFQRARIPAKIPTNCVQTMPATKPTSGSLSFAIAASKPANTQSHFQDIAAKTRTTDASGLLEGFSPMRADISMPEIKTIEPNKNAVL